MRRVRHGATQAFGRPGVNRNARIDTYPLGAGSIDETIVRAPEEALGTGTYTTLTGALDYASLNTLMRRCTVMRRYPGLLELESPAIVGHRGTRPSGQESRSAPIARSLTLKA